MSSEGKVAVVTGGQAAPFESTFIRILALANQWREIELRIVM